MKQRVIVAMSGGVDSAVAAGLLVEAGYDVVGLTMRLWTQPDRTAPIGKQSCCGVEAVEDARAVCQALGIPHYVQNFEREFSSRVVTYFVESYARGETPNPCLACNRHVKFDALLRRATALGADYVATGHYARIVERDGRFRLLRAVDLSKDQSYVLFNLGQEDLRRILMPVGEYSKHETRALARRMGLPVADKAESQDICFIPDRDYRRFVRARGLQVRPGTVVDLTGRVLARHQGVHDFTVGQRRGLGVAGGVPLYVRSVDARTGTVTAVSREALAVIACTLRDVSFTDSRPREERRRIEAEVRVRYRTPPVGATIEAAGGRARLRFSSPIR